MSAFRALIAASALFAGCVRAAAGAEIVGALPDGGISVTQSMGGAPAATVELWYRAPSTGFGATPVVSLARLAAETVLASKPLAGKPLGTIVSEAGGRIAVNVYGDSIAISVSAPAQAASVLVRAMTTAFFAPVITEDGYHEAQQTVAQAALISGFNPDDFTRDAVFGALFSAGPAHYPISGSPSAIQRISLEAVRSYASRAFRSQNAVLVAVGAVDASVTHAAVAGRSLCAANAGAEPKTASPLAHLPRLIAKSFDDAGGAYGWAGPPIADERAATAMDFIADYLFRPDLGLVSRRLAQTQPEASVSGQFITLHDPGVLFRHLHRPKTKRREGGGGRRVDGDANPSGRRRFRTCVGGVRISFTLGSANAVIGGG